jgi:alpha-beta hydrolase superfamily lysophospholipase
MITAQSPPRDVSIPSLDGTELRGWYWTRPAPRSVLVIVHGFGEHGGCYRHVAEALGPALEVDVLAADQRGHGRSAGRRGVVRRFDDLRADARAALDWTARNQPAAPRYLLGHSNGGLLTLLVARDLASDSDSAGLRSDREPAGLILSNPALQIAAPVPPAKRAVGRLLLRCAPWLTLSGKLDPSLMTRDPAMQREHLTDPLRHSRISPPLFFGMDAAGPAVVQDAPTLLLPILMLLGGADPVIDPATSRRAFERLGSPDKTLKVYPEMRHEPLNELGREQVFADIIEWLRPRLERGDAHAGVADRWRNIG